MTLKIYRKAFAGLTLSASMLLTSLVGGAVASTGNRVNGLTGQDLLSGGISVAPGINVAPTIDLLNKSAVQPSVAASSSFSRTIRFSAIGSTPSTKSASDKSPSVVESMMAQRNVDEIAQEVSSPVDGTFAPLTDDDLRQLLLIDPNFVPSGPRPFPASGFLTPSAYGADWGDAFVGLSGVTAGNDDFKWDGSASAGIGFGDAIENVGLELSLGIISLDGLGEDGTIGFKLHKVFPEANNLAVALGWSNPIKWGDANQAEDTFYGVATHRFDLQPNSDNTLPLTVSLGVGTGSFRSKGAISAGNNTPNVFGSVGLRVIPEVSVVSGWTGNALGLGVSAVPFDFPLVFTAGVSDITGNNSNGARFNASAGYSFGF